MPRYSYALDKNNKITAVTSVEKNMRRYSYALDKNNKITAVTSVEKKYASI